MLDPDKIRDNLRDIKADIAEAARKANRDPQEITLVAVSKLHPAQAIASLVQEGHLDIGENYVQEAKEKQAALNDARIRWHFVGQVQTKKAKYLIGNFHLIHAVDRTKLADALHSRAESEEIKQPVLLQVNISGESSKAGVQPEGLKNLVRHIVDNCNCLHLQGLMGMPALFDQGEAARPYFAKLRTLKQEIEQEFSIQMPHLSMGMSGDFSSAIQEGSTLVRIGTNIFGERE